jgi:NDP-sugar pyrophosphorylase family protein
MNDRVRAGAQSLGETTALILAGGLGTRLRSVVADLPKVLAPVHGRPFLACLLDQLADAGLTHAVLCTGYRADLVEAAFGAKYRSLTLEYSQEASPLGTGGALRLAIDRVRSQTVLAMNGDSFVDVDIPSFFSEHVRSRLESSLLLTKVIDTARYGCVTMDCSGRVLNFEEKGARHGAGWINAGVYLIDRSLLENVPGGVAVSLERDLLPQWIAGRLGGIPCRGKFLDIGTPESFAETETFFQPVRSTNAA